MSVECGVRKATHTCIPLPPPPPYAVCTQDAERLRHAVGLKAYSSQQPLEEFRLEANAAFLGLLAAYRDAVAARLLAPDVRLALPPETAAAAAAAAAAANGVSSGGA